MKDCAQAVHEMLMICRAVAGLASTDSAHLVKLTEICLAVCARCESVCAPHQNHHVECKQCMLACQHTQQAAKAFLG